MLSPHKIQEESPKASSILEENNKLAGSNEGVLIVPAVAIEEAATSLSQGIFFHIRECSDQLMRTSTNLTKQPT